MFIKRYMQIYVPHHLKLASDCKSSGPELMRCLELFQPHKQNCSCLTTGWVQQGHCYLMSEPLPGMEVNPDKSQLQLLQGTVTLELTALKKTLIKVASRMPLH